ncbi:hypothetical protein DPX16_0338 [Anabarilius grahami]|uniref:Uncharacterized protein n=1 Tax=Anabarilius grahami TaxID=495550 RepID=A0A3N0YL25_ANAGA|nr:hypothetical protein DPX16_0338 [Anabarilius grahami]
MLIKDSGSTTPVPPGSPDSLSPPPQLIHSSPAMSPPPSTAVTSTVLICPSEQIIPDESWVSQPSLRPLQLTAESGSAPPAALHLLPQAATPVSNASQTTHITAPAHTVLSTSTVVPQSHLGATVMSTAAHPLSSSMPSVPQQPTTATLLPHTRLRGVLRTALPPVTTHSRLLQPPFTSYQASAIPPTVPSHAQPPSFLPFSQDGHPAYPEQDRVLWELNEAAGAIDQHTPHEQRDFYYDTIASAASALVHDTVVMWFLRQ